MTAAGDPVKAIQDGRRPVTARRAVAGLLVPVFNLVWAFRVLPGWRRMSPSGRGLAPFLRRSPPPSTRVLPSPERRVDVLRVARLAVGLDARGVGIGKALLRFGLELAERMRDELGCVGVLVDAKAEAVDFYRSLGFEPVSTLAGASRIVPPPTPMFLPLGAIPQRRLAPAPGP